MSPPSIPGLSHSLTGFRCVDYLPSRPWVTSVGKKVLPYRWREV